MNSEARKARHPRARWLGLGRNLGCGILLLFWCSSNGYSASSDGVFRAGLESYRDGDYGAAAEAFRQSADLRPATGTLQNLGNAEWQLGAVGSAIVAWEQSLWVDPFNENARNNLRFARKSAQVEAPDLFWYEVVSTWLPVNWWAGLAGLSLWVAVAMITLPGILRWRKTTWHQAVAALGLMVFLLTLPAHWGVHTRLRTGIVVRKGTSLRFTPTEEAQVVTRLAAGEPVRCESVRGKYVLVRAGSQALHGWIEQAELGWLCPRTGKIGK